MTRPNELRPVALQGCRVELFVWHAPCRTTPCLSQYYTGPILGIQPGLQAATMQKEKSEDDEYRPEDVADDDSEEDSEDDDDDEGGGGDGTASEV